VAVGVVDAHQARRRGFVAGNREGSVAHRAAKVQFDAGMQGKFHFFTTFF